MSKIQHATLITIARRLNSQKHIVALSNPLAILSDVGELKINDSYRPTQRPYIPRPRSSLLNKPKANSKQKANGVRFKTLIMQDDLYDMHRSPRIEPPFRRLGCSRHI